MLRPYVGLFGSSNGLLALQFVHSVVNCRHGEPDQHGGDGDLGPMEQYEQRVHAARRRDHRDQEQVAAAPAQGT